MFGRIRERMTFANTMSLAAVFIALGGTSYAAVKLPRNSVGAPQIKTGGVGSSEVKNGALRNVDFRAGELPAGAKGDKGDKGDRGDKGDKGDQGDQGPAAVFPGATVQYESAAAGLALNTSASYSIECPAGQQAIGGGARGDITDSEYTRITSSRPLTPGGGFPTDGQSFTGWRATVVNRGSPGGAFPANPPGGAIQPEVWAICVPMPTP